MMKPSPTKARLLLAILLATALPGCQSPPQTIGEMIDRSGQNPDRLRMRRSDPTSTSKSLDENSATAINHYEQILTLNSAPETRAEALRRAADLRIKAADSGLGDDANLHRGIALYQQLLAEFPHYPNNDHVLYQLARAQQLASEDDASITSLRNLAENYPGSNRAADASFRAAEMLFLRSNYEEAVVEYARVAAMGENTLFYDMAQYKYGWAQYKLANFEAAIPPFIALLNRLIPTEDNQLNGLAAVSGAAQVQGMSSDAMRALCLSLAAIDGGRSIGRYFSGKNEPTYYVTLYDNLGKLLLEKRRFTDAAGVFETFVETHPDHKLAPRYASQSINAYDSGGFTEPALLAREDFAERYSPLSSYWQGEQPPVEILRELRGYMDELAKHYHAKAQQTKDETERRAQFAIAANWYQQILTTFSDDPERAKLNQLYADALFDGGQTEAAAQQYTITAYDYGAHSGAADAALAAVKAWRRYTTEVPEQQHRDALSKAIAASQRLAASFPNHPEKPAVLLGAAEDLYGMEEYQQALDAAQILVSDAATGNVTISPAQKTKALSLIADAYFALENYPQAEQAYASLLGLIGSEDEIAALAVERLSVSIYRQGEAARDTGDKQQAAQFFLRAADANPNSALAANASYDAGVMWFDLEQWQPASETLELFRQRYPQHALVAEADKLLASAYQKSDQPARAADAYARIASRTTESADTLLSASLLSAQLYDKAGQTSQAATAYEQHLQRYPDPVEAAIKIRQRLAEIAKQQNDTPRYQHWLEEMILADQAADAQRSDFTRSVAAQASLELARGDIAAANTIALTHPIAKSLPRRKQAMEKAIASLNRTAGYGIAVIATEATHELGGLYRDFARALMHSQAPALSGDALEQYQIMLEEQAYPFEEKAIVAFETNLQRLQQGIWNAGIRNSADALADMVPARYGKNLKTEDSYESLF